MKQTAWQFVSPYLWRYRGRFALGLGALLGKDVLSAVLPLVIRTGIDALTARFDMSAVLRLAALLVLISAVKGVFQYWMRVIIIGVSRDIEFDLRNDLFAHLVRLDQAFYGRFRTGDLMARSTNDLNAVRMMIGPGVMYWCETSLTFVLATAVMLWVDWPLALIALAPAPLVSFAVVFFGQRIHDRFEKIQRQFSDISSRVQENLSGVRVVRAYSQESAEMRHFEVLNRDYIHQNLALAKISTLFYPLLQALIGVSFLLVLWAGGYRLLAGKISLGSFVMFNTYMGMLIWPMIGMGWVVNLVQRGKASLGRLRELLEEPPSIAAPAAPKPLLAPPRGEIEFREVEVRYPSRHALAGIHLSIQAGSTVAIVGHTGSGKSTLVSLIPRLIDPTSGQVLLDGVDLRELDPLELRRHIGYVPQETFLFSATLAGNIAFGVPGATREQIQEAARLAGLEPDLESLPQGLDTVIGERGITLSGGQKQRTAIARAILRNPAILILDDALSAVDTLTEERILNALSSVMRGRTTILISHRVSTVRNAGRIIVIEHGVVAEQGSHDELVRRGGYYADLYNKQLLEEELESI
ncbi:MAG: ABC transporter ATP-binding protein/permease [Bryobacteraceae bacterium]|nr:ABC transporter ATP-binding protein/permease [Bryobacteraceae bacterium]